MISHTHDFDTPERLLLERIEAELGTRTSEEIAQDIANADEQFQRLMEDYRQYCVMNKKVGNKEKLDAFLSTATTLRKFTAEHTGWIKISVSEEWTGIIEMRFQTLFFFDNDSVDSHKIFASVFEQYRDITVSSYEEMVQVQIFASLYDIIPVAVLDEEQEPR